jgi:hypothetical protein
VYHGLADGVLPIVQIVAYGCHFWLVFGLGVGAWSSSASVFAGRDLRFGLAGRRLQYESSEKEEPGGGQGPDDEMTEVVQSQIFR